MVSLKERIDAKLKRINSDIITNFDSMEGKEYLMSLMNRQYIRNSNCVQKDLPL